MSTPILTTKLYIPPARAELVARPHLTDRLNDGLQRPASITLISAPPGFGKTTLVSEWIKAGAQGGGRSTSSETGASERLSSTRTPALRTAWVSLDEQDNDPIRFWTYVIAALDTVQEGVGANAMTLLQAPEPQPIELTLTTLINALSAIPDPFILTLDDYHLIERRPIHDALSFLLEHLPPQVRLVIISRSDPPLPLTRFRVRNQLVELRESDLRFTPAEAATFLNQVMGLDLSAEDVAALETRTEGWIAGLQLAALSMQGRDDVHNFVQAFTGSHRYVIDYLAEEVLSRQPAPVREFLLKTSFLERLHGPLCDAVLSKEAGERGSRGDRTLPPALVPDAKRVEGSLLRSPAQEILEHLEQANLFLIPLDDERRWYRYHHLFADFLQEHLRKTVDQAERARLHQRASVWYMDNDLPTEAVNHALAADDIDRAVQLIELLSIDLLTLGETVTLLNWLEALPAEKVRSSPRLSLTRAWVSLLLGIWVDIEPALQDAEAGLVRYEKSGSAGERLQPGTDVEGMRGEAAVIRSMILSEQGQVEQAIALSEEALERLPADSLLAQSVIKMHLGGDYAIIGDFARATNSLQESISEAKQVDNLITVLSASGALAEIQQSRGQLAEADKTYRQALEYIETYTRGHRYAGQTLPMTGRTYLGLAEIRRKQNDLAEAMNYLTTGLELGRQGDIGGILHVGYIILAQIRQAQNDWPGAVEAIEKAKQLPQDMAAPTYDWAAAVQARLWLAQGNLAAAAEWAETCELPLDDTLRYDQFPGEYTTLARVYLAQEQFEETTDLLARMEAVEETLQRDGRMLEILMLQALAFYAQGNLERAMPPLERALALAEKSGYIRLLLDEGRPMANLLRQAAARGVARDLATKLLSAFSRQEQQKSKEAGEQGSVLSPSLPHSPALIESLSERELEVLGLIADGLSNQEIAEALVIAEGTVKKHIHNIFGKLGVSRRTQVVRRAKELGLLAD